MASMRIRQFSLRETTRSGKVVLPTEISPEQNAADLQLWRDELGALTGEAFKMFLPGLAPYGLYMPQHIVDTCEAIQVALDKALTSLVTRWWTDGKRRFPERMPLEPVEERVLRWMDGEGRGLCKSYVEDKGFLRPDVLLDEVMGEDGEIREHVWVCEINGRLPYNGWTFAYAMGRTAAKIADLERAGLKPAADISTLTANLDAMINNFDASKPLHIVKNWVGADVRFFAQEWETRTGRRARFITPEELRLKPSKESPTGYRLFCPLEQGATNGHHETDEKGEPLEEIFQLSLDLTQDGYKDMSFEMLCHIATCCVNPLRNVFLLGDKRLLAILGEELDDLVHVQGVLTQEEADLLRTSIASSFVPSSATWEAVTVRSATDPTYKDKWILKASRDAFSHGHVFGSELSNDEWLAALAAGKAAGDRPGTTANILQQYIVQAEYDIVRHHTGEVERFHIVSAFLTLRGKFAGMGPQRIGLARAIFVNEEAGGIGMSAIVDR